MQCVAPGTGFTSSYLSRVLVSRFPMRDLNTIHPMPKVTRSLFGPNSSGPARLPTSAKSLHSYYSTFASISLPFSSAFLQAPYCSTDQAPHDQYSTPLTSMHSPHINLYRPVMAPLSPSHEHNSLKTSSQPHVEFWSAEMWECIIYMRHGSEMSSQKTVGTCHATG